MHTSNDRHDDPVLDQRLRAFFTGRAVEPLAAEVLWRRIEPAIKQHGQSAADGATMSAGPDRADTATAPVVPQHSATIRPHTTSKRRVAGNLLALAAVLAICLSAFALFHRQSAQTPVAVKTVQRGELLWQKVTLPAGVVLADGEGVRVTKDGGTPVDTGQPANWPASNATLQVAPSNGAVAYICHITKGGAAKVWRTADAGQQWSLLPAAPGGVQSEYNSCGVAIDANNPDNVVIGLGGSANVYTAYALFAGATQWKSLPRGMGQFASSNDVFYAIGNLGGSGAKERTYYLYVSTDQMQTWQEVNDAPLIAENLVSAKATKWNGVIGVSQVWVQPKTGELLAQTYDGVLWRSSDQGQHWTRIKLPTLPPAAELTPSPGEQIVQGGPTAAVAFVQQPVANKPFSLCAMIFDQQQIDYNVAPLYCSNDSGQSWTRRPRTAVDWGNGKPSSFELPRAMLGDGELLAWDVQSISIYPGANTSAPAARVIGTIPPPRDANNIPSGIMATTPSGVTLWQPWDPQTLYVAVYNVTARR